MSSTIKMNAKRTRCSSMNDHTKPCFMPSSGVALLSDGSSTLALKKVTDDSDDDTVDDGSSIASSRESHSLDDNNSRSVSSSAATVYSDDTESRNGDKSSVQGESNCLCSGIVPARRDCDGIRGSLTEDTMDESLSDQSQTAVDSTCSSFSPSVSRVQSGAVKRNRNGTCTTTSINVAPSVPLPHNLLSTRWFKTRDKWDFRVGQYADNRSSPSKQAWSWDDFDIVRSLGGGKFGLVVLAENLQSAEYVALKEIAKQDVYDHGSIKSLRREVEIQTSLCHKNILQSFGYFVCGSSVTLVLEYADNGNLNEYRMAHPDGALSLATAKFILRQVLAAVAHLESRHISHRDVKGENIVLTASQTTKLCDFGHSIHAPPPHEEVRTKTLVGTPEFVAPEVLTRNYAACHVDPWSVGVVAYELVHRKTPFFVKHSERNRIAAEKGYDVAYKVNFDKIRAFVKLDFPVTHVYDDEQHCMFYDFLSSLIQPDPHVRLSASDALKHSWLTTSSTTNNKSSFRRRRHRRPVKARRQPSKRTRTPARREKSLVY